MTTEVALWKHPTAPALEKQFNALAPQFAAVLGDVMSPERLIRTLMISLDRTPKLYECDRQTLFMAAMSAACLGLEVDGVTGQAFILPFAGKAQLITGYKGYNTLAGRGGFSIRGGVVRDGDGFEFDKANALLVHRPKIGNTGRIIAAWALAASKALPSVIEVIGIDELMTLRGRAPGAAKKDSPWNDPQIGFPAMCEKTAKRRLARSMPLNLLQSSLHQYHNAARLDEAVEEQGHRAWIDPSKGVIIDAEEVAAPATFPPVSRTETINVTSTADASCEWPELPPEIAKRVAKFCDFLRAGTLTDIDARWKHKDSKALMEQVKIASTADYDRIASMYNDLRSELALAEKERS
jgi:recombination protein RecT